MIRPDLLVILRCPQTYQKLSIASPELIERLNAQINARQIRNRAGNLVKEPLQAALIREDGAVLYPVRGELPIMLIDEAISIAGNR